MHRVNVNVNLMIESVIQIWNPATCSCQNDKYLESILDNSVITCYEIIDAETRTILTSFNEKK